MLVFLFIDFYPDPIGIFDVSPATVFGRYLMNRRKTEVIGFLEKSVVVLNLKCEVIKPFTYT